MPSFSNDRGCSPWKHTPSLTPESTQNVAQGTKRHPPFQQALHQPMPLSPRSGGHTRQPQPDQHHQHHQQHEQPGLDESLLLKHDPSRGSSSSSSAQHHVGFAASRTSPVPGKTSPVSLPDIHEHSKQGLSPSGFTSEEGDRTSPGDGGPHGLGTKILLESRGSLARFVRMESLETVKEDSEMEPDLPPRRELSSAEKAALAHFHDLEERRRALAMVAFVRHSTADMQAAAKLAAARSKAAPHPHPLHSSSPTSLPTVSGPHPDPQHPAPHQQHHAHPGHPQQKNQAHGSMDSSRAFSPPATETWRHSKELPGCLYGLSAEFEGAKEMHLADSQWPPQLPSTLFDSNGQQQESPALQLPHIVHPSVTTPSVNNLNGIGHPVINKDAEMAKALLESQQIADRRSPPLSTKLSKLRKIEKQHHEDELGSPKGKKSSNIKQILAMETFVKRGPRHLMNKETLPRARHSQAFLPDPANESSTTFWKGKRLNQLEKRLDGHLSQYRSNRAAKADLLDRVNGYVAEKEAVAAEEAALTMFANERREQRTILFMQRQAQMSNKTAGASRGSPQRQTTSLHSRNRSLFDPLTAEPIDDGHPMPLSKAPFWAGFTVLMQNAKKLGTLITNERRKKLATQDAAARKIQAGWRGFCCRRPLMKMLSKAASQKSEQWDGNLQAAADLIMDFIKARQYAGRKEAAAAAMRATAAQAKAGKSKAQLLRGIRMAVMRKQWDRVEAAAINVSQKRTRGDAALGINDKSHALQVQRQERSMMEDFLAARKKGDMPAVYTEDQREAAIRKATQNAVSRTFATDKIIQENWKTVPEAVKTMLLDVYNEIKATAYVQLIGLVWQARARYKAMKRMRDNERVAKGGLGLHVNDENTYDRGRAPSRNLEELQEELQQGFRNRSRSASRSRDQTPSGLIPEDVEGDAGNEGAGNHADVDEDGVTDTQERPLTEAQEGLTDSQQPDVSALAPAGRTPSDGKNRSVSIFDPAVEASEAKDEDSEATNQGEEDPSKVGALSKDSSAREGKDKAETAKGTTELKYTTSGQRKSFARQKSASRRRPSSVGYHARGRTRVNHSLDACGLLDEGKGPPELPPPKPFLTLMEMKAVMQQGVMETPMFNGFMLKGSMQDRTQALHRQISTRFEGDSKTKQELFKQRQGMQAKAQRGGANQAMRRNAQIEVEQADTQANSWTLALLTARWHAECIPRSKACLTKRLSLLRVDLLDCLMHAKESSPEEMGQHLQHLM